jgi:uncharacterized protein (TIGR02391 family)
MASLPEIPAHAFKPLAKTLGECGIGTDITNTFKELGVATSCSESTKWKRLHHFFVESSRATRSSNQIYAFIQSFMAPARFLGRKEDFEAKRQSLNEVLSFIGVEFGKDGNFRAADKARTIDEAERRRQTIYAKFRGRSMHPEIEKYCKKELLQNNYFHAVFEASKGLAERIREISGADGDGAALVDAAFSLKSPRLALNTLQTETEQSEHKGFAQLLKGCFAAVRNPLAHEPKILWEGEEDAADYFSLISLLHRRLDRCVKVPQSIIENPAVTL